MAEGFATGLANAPLIKPARHSLVNPNRVFVWFVLTIPVVWLLGIAPLAGLAFAAFFLRYRSKIGVPEFALLAIAAALFLSLVIAAATSDRADRLVAAAYNIMILLCACVALNFGREVDLTFARTPRLRVAVLTFFFAYLASIVVSYVVGVPWAREGIAFRSLLMGQLGEDLPGLLGYYATARVTGPDWNSGSSFARPLAFGVYFNEGALMFLLSGIVAMLASRTRLLTVAVGLGLLAGMLLLRGRMLFLASIVALVIALVARAPVARHVRWLIVSISLLGVIAFWSLNPDWVDNSIDRIISSREASSATRFLSYSVAFDVTWRESPIFGLGIKPRDESLFSNISTPIGSHSTIVSVFTKGGILAFAPLLLFFVSVLVAAFRLMFLEHAGKTYRNAQAALGATALIVLAWMLVEDFDAPIYGSMMAFMVLGSAFGLLDRLRVLEKLGAADQRRSADPLE